MTETKDKIRGIEQLLGGWIQNPIIIETVMGKIAESNREAYTQGAIDAINAIVLDEKDLPKGFEKVKSVQMKKAKEFLKDL